MQQVTIYNDWQIPTKLKGTLIHWSSLAIHHHDLFSHQKIIGTGIAAESDLVTLILVATLLMLAGSVAGRLL